MEDKCLGTFWCCCTECSRKCREAVDSGKFKDMDVRSCFPEFIVNLRKDNYTIVRDCVQIGEEFTTEDIYLKVGDVLGFKDRRTSIEHINRYLNSWEKYRVMERAERNRKGDGHRTHYTLWRRVR